MNAVIEDQTKQYYQWLFENTVDLNAPDFLLNMVKIYSNALVLKGRFTVALQAIYDTLEYEIESIPSDVLQEALETLVHSGLYTMAVRRGWVDKITEEQERRETEMICPDCGQLKEVCEANGYWSPWSLYEPQEWICGYEPAYDAHRDEIPY